MPSVVCTQLHTSSPAASALEHQVHGYKAMFGGEELQRAAAAMAGSLVGGTIKAYLAKGVPPSLAQLSTFSRTPEVAQPTGASGQRLSEDSVSEGVGAGLVLDSSDVVGRELLHAARIYQQLEDRYMGRRSGRHNSLDTQQPRPSASGQQPSSNGLNGLHHPTHQQLPTEGSKQQPDSQQLHVLAREGASPPSQEQLLSSEPGTDQGHHQYLNQHHQQQQHVHQKHHQHSSKAALDMYDLFYGHGLVLQELASRAVQGSPEQASLLKQACSKYEAALQLRPVSHSALYNWGVALSDLARLTRPTDPVTARWCLEAAASRYAEALRLHPDNPQALNNWGLILQELSGEVRDRRERALLLRQALAKFRHAVRIRPDFDRGCYNLGTVCYAAACTLQSELAMSPKAGTQPPIETMSTHAAVEGTDAMSSVEVNHPGSPLATSSTMSLADVQEAGRQRAAREAEARNLFSCSAQYILLAFALAQHKDVYRKSLTVVKQLLPLPFLRAGHLSAPVSGTEGSPHEQWRREWYVLDHVSLRAATTSEGNLTTGSQGAGTTAGGGAAPLPRTPATVTSAAAPDALGPRGLVIPLQEISEVLRVEDPSLPEGSSLWIGQVQGPGIYLVADDEDEADAWADALSLGAYITHTRTTEALTDVLQPHATSSSSAGTLGSSAGRRLGPGAASGP